VVAADVKEAAEKAVVTSDEDKRLAGDLPRYIPTALPKLPEASDKLPRTKKYGVVL